MVFPVQERVAFKSNPRASATDHLALVATAGAALRKGLPGGEPPG
jgi:hypothetical protein